MVEKQDMDACSVLGGQQMILTGQNFSADSKVIFMEKTHGKCFKIGFQRLQVHMESAHFFTLSVQIWRYNDPKKQFIEIVPPVLTYVLKHEVGAGHTGCVWFVT